MLTPNVIAQARGLLPKPVAAATLRILRDPDDTYLSNDLSHWLLNPGAPEGGSTLTVRTPPDELREIADAGQLHRLAETMCAPANAQVIWLFAGCGNQLSALDKQMAPRAGCHRVVVAGSGGTELRVTR